MNDIFKMIFDNLPFPMWVKDLDFNFILVNNSFENLCNKSKEEILDCKKEDIYLLHCKTVVKSRQAKLIDIIVNNSLRQCLILPINNDNKELVAIAGIFIEQNFDKENNIAEKIMDILPGVIFYKDRQNKYVYANKDCIEFYKQRGIENIIGKTDLEINEDPTLVKKFLDDDKIVIENKIAIYNEAVFVDDKGSKQYREVVKIPLIDNDGNVSGIVGRSMDVTEKRIAQERLKHISYTDILTEVYNRSYFEERILELSKKDYLPLGIIMGDTNGLKEVNDTFGHQEGDKLLKATAMILKESCKDVGEVFRIGGDEFVILVPKSSSTQCNEIIHRINRKCREYDNDLFRISISLGGYVKEDHEMSIHKALKEVDDKVYIEKQKKYKSINL